LVGALVVEDTTWWIVLAAVLWTLDIVGAVAVAPAAAVVVVGDMLWIVLAVLSTSDIVDVAAVAVVGKEGILMTDFGCTDFDSGSESCRMDRWFALHCLRYCCYHFFHHRS